MGPHKFFGDDSGSELDDNNDSLPFPKPLDHSLFLQRDFEPTTFLASLSERYQTLDDLRNELRDLSQHLGKGLLALVNDNLQEFLSLGDVLRGGEDKIEAVRVKLLGFERDLGSIRDNIDQRRITLASLVDEKKCLMKGIQAGKCFLEFIEQIEDLEAELMLSATNERANGTDATNADFADSEEEAEGVISMHRLERHVEQYELLTVLNRRLQSRSPHNPDQTKRITRIKNTLSIDLDSALKLTSSTKQEHAGGIAREDRLRELLYIVHGETTWSNDTK